LRGPEELKEWPPPLEYAPYPTPSGYAPRPFRWVPPQSSGPPVPRDPEMDRILRGLLAYNDTGGEFLLLYWIAQVYPLPEVEEAARNGATKMARDLPENSYDLRVLRFIDPDYRPPWVGCDLNRSAGDCFDYHGLYCDALPVPSNFVRQIRDHIRTVPPGRGHNLFHYLIALMEMERRGCGGREVSDALRQGLDIAAREMAALTEDRQAPGLSSPTSSTEASAELAFYLLRSGARERIEPAWMASIEGHLRAMAPLIERGDPSVNIHGSLLEALVTLLWRQGRMP
ncbi:MAG: hypothetical protein QXQ87_09690, partial [Halobacteria archaeon]